VIEENERVHILSKIKRGLAAVNYWSQVHLNSCITISPGKTVRYFIIKL
jgi:hypothetical protein